MQLVRTEKGQFMNAHGQHVKTYRQGGITYPEYCTAEIADAVIVRGVLGSVEAAAEALALALGTGQSGLYEVKLDDGHAIVTRRHANLDPVTVARVKVQA